MKKICGLMIFTVLFFTRESFGGNHLSFPAGNKFPGTSVSFPGDPAKKIVPADTAKKTTDDDTTDDNVRSYAIGIESGSDQSFHGIHSSKKIPYIEPNFTYTAPSGFYAEVSDQFILSKDSGGFDAFAINPGWNIDLTDNATLNFNISHYIFRAHTPISIRSDLSDVVEGYIDQWKGETEGRFTIDYDYYKNSSAIKTPGDIVFTPDLSHTFEFKLTKKSSLSLLPEGSLDVGTRNAYSHYLVNSDSTYSQSNIKKNKVKAPNNSSFGLLDYNLVFSINYKIGNFELEPAVNYTAPLYKVTGVPSKPFGYGTINLTYTIE